MGDPTSTEPTVADPTRALITALAAQVRPSMPDDTLAELWAVEHLRRGLETEAGRLLEVARSTASSKPSHTWEKLGLAMGISPQGARQRLIRYQASRTSALPP